MQIRVGFLALQDALHLEQVGGLRQALPALHLHRAPDLKVGLAVQVGGLDEAHAVGQLHVQAEQVSGDELAVHHLHNVTHADIFPSHIAHLAVWVEHMRNGGVDFAVLAVPFHILRDRLHPTHAQHKHQRHGGAGAAQRRHHVPPRQASLTEEVSVGGAAEHLDEEEREKGEGVVLSRLDTVAAEVLQVLLKLGVVLRVKKHHPLTVLPRRRIGRPPSVRLTRAIARLRLAA
mmetsp:Transcript_39834/g.71522  ORF Transcript_39834/g.71522 Transcript_39834/m.71522 type:complete len:232 (+) Transcript_39834:1257-1952(+)